MSTDENELDYNRLEEQAEQAHTLLQHVRTRRKEIAEEIRTLEKRMKALKVELPKLAVEIEGCDTTREELTRRIPELREQSIMSPEDAKKLRHLNVNVQKCKSDLAACVSRASKLQAEVEKLQKAILDAGGTGLKKQQKACEKAEAKLNNATKELNEAHATIKTSKKACKKAENAKQSAEIELQNSASKLENLQAEFDSLETSIEHARTAYENAKNVENEKKQYLDDVNKESEELRKAQSSIKCAEVDLLAKIENIDKSMKDFERRSKHWEDEISKLHGAEAQDDEYDYSDVEDEDEDEDDEDDTHSDDNEEEEKEDQDFMDDDNMKQPKQEKRRKENNGKNKTSLPTLPHAALEQYDKDEIKECISVLEEEKEVMASNANMAAIAEYRKKEADYLSR